MTTHKKTSKVRLLFTIIEEDGQPVENRELLNVVVAIKIIPYYFYKLLQGKEVFYNNLLSDVLDPGKKYQVLKALFIYDYKKF